MARNNRSKPITKPAITSVFSKWLGMKARELEAQGLVKIIPVEQFPAGAPLHEDGSAEYDPRKPLVLFAVAPKAGKGNERWRAVLREHDLMWRRQRAA